VDYLVSSSNKNLQGVPGFAFVLARKSELDKAKGNARSLSLDLHGQWVAMNDTQQFRFTPPTHTLLAFHQALLELEAEGGIPARRQRYASVREILRKGFAALGFQEYLPPSAENIIITTYLYPKHPNWNFTKFYTRLSDLGCVIYPGKLTKTDCFRVGNIGALTAADCHKLLDAVQVAMKDLNIPLPLSK